MTYTEYCIYFVKRRCFLTLCSPFRDRIVTICLLLQLKKLLWEFERSKKNCPTDVTDTDFENTPILAVSSYKKTDLKKLYVSMKALPDSFIKKSQKNLKSAVLKLSKILRKIEERISQSSQPFPKIAQLVVMERTKKYRTSNRPKLH